MSANNPSSQLHDPDYDVAVRDPEAAARGLALVQQLLDEGEDAADRKDLKVGEEIKKELRDTLSELHPADIAYILEALPLDERLIVWDCVRSGRDGEILVEVNEGVRETLIDAMNRDELVDAVESLDTDEIADLVEDLPPDVVAEVQEGLSHEERAQLRAAMSYPEGYGRCPYGLRNRIDPSGSHARYRASLSSPLKETPRPYRPGICD